MIDHERARLPAPRGTGWLFAAILFVAAGLRLWAVDFGLDIERVRPDEEFVVGKAMAMLESGDLNPHFFHYPALLLYVDAALLGVFELFAKAGFDPRLVGRLLSVVCGVGTVAVAGVMGTRLFSPRAGLAAAAFLAVAYQHVRESHFATTDVPMVFLVTVSVAFAVEGRRSKRHLWIRLAAVSAGLAASTKYTGVLALLPLALVIATLDERSWRERGGELVICVFLAFAVFASTSPYLFLDTEGALSSVNELFRETWGERTLTVWNPWYPVTFSLRYGLGIPLLALGIVGLMRTARSPRALVLLGWSVPFLAAAMATPTAFARYALPIVPPIALAAAFFLELLRARGLVWMALFLSGAIPNAHASVSFDRLLSREDTRSLARKWIQDHLTPGTRVQICWGYGAPSLPPDFPVRWVGSRLGAVRAAERDGFDVLITHEHPALERYSRVDRSLSRRLGAAVLLQRFDPFAPGKSPGIYDAVDAFYLPYSGFQGVERPGPRVSVWKLSR
ncbi:MAG TPA: glycosyltransferase family 39 protein [Vicinamibacteria bacterium]|nr:glycosyltransferase family 39 protein [Vicinamibacteria bacterium]